LLSFGSYDLAAMGSFLGYDQFRQRFGTELDQNGNPRISPAWQAGIQNGVQAGSIIGLWANGYISEYFGYKKTMYGALLASVIFNFLHFFAQGIGMVVAGSVLLGLPWGVFQTLTVTYASDITPSTIRPYLTTYINLCWVMGQLVAAGALRGCQTLGNDWGWRIPIAIQWVWVPFIFLGAYMAPESPWWLVRKGRYEEARASLVKATTPQPDVNFDPDQALALIRHTNDLEQAMNSGVNYIDCFKGVEKRRTLIACVVWLTQALCGAAMMGYSVQIYRESGLDEEGALNLNIGQYCLGFIGTIGSWFLMRRIGRRMLYNWGLIILFSFLMVIGGLGVISRDNTDAAWALGSVLLVYTLFYNFTVGPVCYAIVAEISSTRLKIKTVVLARNVYNLVSRIP
jgi:SP family general alpha glucoside:H+ symporter-like MFS transporter